MKILSLDTETTIRHDASPFSKGNEEGLVAWSWATEEGSYAAMWAGPEPVQELLDPSTMLVGANIKFDLNWLSVHGVDFSDVMIWDVLCAQFVLDRQLVKFPSLNYCAEKYGLPIKLDVVKTDYWEKNIDTKDVPEDVLLEYAAYDAELALNVYKEQIKLMTPRQIQLVKLIGLDTLVLSEMECNGLVYDEDLCNEQAVKIGEEIEKITKELSRLYPGIPINFNSPMQLSAVLYGGTIVEVVKEQVGFFKTGKQAGQPKFRNVEVEHQLPRRFSPLHGSETSREGIYKTSEDVLRKLKGGGKQGRQLIECLLRLSKLDKLKGTYYEGLPKLNEEMHWPKGHLHGKFNQTLAATGRLTSSSPNQQNFAADIQDIFVSKFS